MVGAVGLEPTTLCLPGRCAHQAALRPDNFFLHEIAYKNITLIDIKAKHAQDAGDYLLSQPVKASTIGSRGLDCRVRNGIGYDPSDKSPASWARLALMMQTIYAKVV